MNIELLLERIYDVLWHNEIIEEDTDLEDFKNCLRKDIKIQLENILEDYKNNAR